MVDHRREVGRSVQGNMLKGIEVSLEHPRYPEAVRVVWSEVQEELIRHLASWWNSGAESER